MSDFGFDLLVVQKVRWLDVRLCFIFRFVIFFLRCGKTSAAGNIEGGTTSSTETYRVCMAMTFDP